MAQLFGAILLIALAMFAIKVAVLLLFLVGLIFRTKETIGLIIVLGAFALLRNYPLASLTLLGIGVAVAVYRASKKPGAPPELTDETPP